MTYKNAMAGLDAGGGKSVILAPERIAEDRIASARRVTQGTGVR
jgi:glutamate dehydrogenase/leucine dehydrogenase